MTQTEIWKQTREEARNLGLKVYEGRPCKYRHGNLRYISNDACLECNRLYVKKYKKKHKDKAKESSKTQYEKNKFKISQKNKETQYQLMREYEILKNEGVAVVPPRSENLVTDIDLIEKEKANNKSVKVYLSEFGCLKCGSHERYVSYNLCASCCRKNDANYYKNNKENKISKGNDYYRKRSKKDPLYKFSSSVRSCIHGAFKRRNFNKKSKSETILKCSMREFSNYIAEQFTEGMSFDNYGRKGWVLDHKKPLATATTEEEVIELNHYTNFQPLWFSENAKKGAKYKGIDYQNYSSKNENF